MVSTDALAAVKAKTWYHKIEIAPGVFTPGIYDPTPLLGKMNFPADLTGKSVLDIGAYDGFFTFEAEKRGAAKVVAVDQHPIDHMGFALAQRLLESKAEYHVASVYDLSPAVFGTFDVVLFFGVLYHLRHPILAFDKIHSVCKDSLLVESQVLDEQFIDHGKSIRLKDINSALTDSPVMQFYPQNELNGDFSNWWSPNVECLRLMLETSGFQVDNVSQFGNRAAMKATRLEFTQPFWY
jgi:tRNA (mo5U34)-methyltransferase